MSGHIITVGCSCDSTQIVVENLDEDEVALLYTLAEIFEEADQDEGGPVLVIEEEE